MEYTLAIGLLLALICVVVIVYAFSEKNRQERRDAAEQGEFYAFDEEDAP